MRVVASLLLAFALLAAGASMAVAAGTTSPASVAKSAAQLPVESFYGLDAFEMIKLSPDGAHIAATVPAEGKRMLVFLRLSDMKQTGGLMPGEDADIDEFVWVNPSQVVYSARERNGSLARPRANPFLYIANADGSPGRVVNRGRMMYLVDALRDDDDHILVGPGLFRIKLSNGSMVDRLHRGSPLHEGYQYPDNTGLARVAVGTVAGEREDRLYARIGPHGDLRDDWQLVNQPADSGVRAGFLGFSADNRIAYLQVEALEGPDSVQALDMRTGERTPVHRHPRVDPYDVLTSPVDGGVVALLYLDGRPKLHVVAPEDRFAKELLKLSKAFPDSFVYPTSYTKDGSVGIYLVQSDTNSGEFYRVDHVRGKADYLAARQDVMLPELMSPMTPFRFAARDGVELEGFITLPRNRAEGSPVPLVVIPHGGPKGPYDRWGFDPEVQLLASRGYGVLQVNFRGSGNYGRQFLDRGNLQWGKGMIDDIVDATNWAIAQGHARPGAICMYGASYGAYASLVAVAREPSLYACAIGNVGVYDIRRMVAEDTFGSGHMTAFFNELLGKGSDLDAISPTSFAERVRVPVLLGAGEKDRIAPPEQTDQMLRQLRKVGATVEHVEYKGEAHGNYLLANRVDWAKRVLSMLDRTIGAGSD